MGKIKAAAEEGKGVARSAARRPQRSEDARSAKREGHPPMSDARTTRSSPLTNRGELERPAIAGHEDVQIVMADTGEVKVVSVRVPVNDQIAMIDGLRFVLGEETFNNHSMVKLGVSDDLYVDALSERLEWVFGFGITRNLNQRRDFYSQTYELGDNYGHVGFGGERQNSTMLVALYGQGAAAARPGWEARLHSFLVDEAKRPVMTRIDLAHDWFDGEVTVDQLDAMHTEGLFTNAYTVPDCRHDGNWKFPNGKGRTLYVGSRHSGLVFRGYEKGKEQGDPASEWVRGEVEISNKCRLIPLDVLLDPSGFYMGAYKKAFAYLGLTVQPERTEIKRKTAAINLDAYTGHTRRQFGKGIGILADLYGAEQAIAMLRDPMGRWPQRLKVPDYQYCDIPVHRRDKVRPYNEFDTDDYDGASGLVVQPSYGARNAIHH